MPSRENKIIWSIHRFWFMLFLFFFFFQIFVAAKRYQHRKPVQHSLMFLLVQIPVQAATVHRSESQIYNYLIHTYMPSIVSKEICNVRVLGSESDANPYTLFQSKLFSTDILNLALSPGDQSVFFSLMMNSPCQWISVRNNSLFCKDYHGTSKNKRLGS